jgi:hypothetical protein
LTDDRALGRTGIRRGPPSASGGSGGADAGASGDGGNGDDDGDGGGCGDDIRPGPPSISLFVLWPLVVATSPDDELTTGAAGTDLSDRTGAGSAGRDSNGSRSPAARPER